MEGGEGEQQGETIELPTSRSVSSPKIISSDQKCSLVKPCRRDFRKDCKMLARIIAIHVYFLLKN